MKAMSAIKDSFQKRGLQTVARIVGALLLASPLAYANFGGVGTESAQGRQASKKTPAKSSSRRPASDLSQERESLIRSLQAGDLEEAKRLISNIPELSSECSTR
jgi:hypothetical protein